MSGSPYTYDADWTRRLESEEHWRLYWNQARMLEHLVRPGDHLLEVGMGSGFMAQYLRSRGVDVTTVDIDEAKRPDIVANVVSWDPPQDYDLLLACEIFEHIPKKEVSIALQRLLPRIRRGLVVSAPFCRWNLLRMEVRLPRSLGTHALTVQIPRWRPRERNHHWELGTGGMRLSQWRQLLSDEGRFTAIGHRRMLGIHYQAMAVAGSDGP